VPQVAIFAADPHELVSGKKQGKRNSEGIAVFKSVRCALEDPVTAELLSVARHEHCPAAASRLLHRPDRFLSLALVPEDRKCDQGHSNNP
jgi:hypothetical protein